MSDTSDESGSASVYNEGTQRTEEDASETRSEPSRKSVDDLPIPVPGHPQESPVAAIGTGGGGYTAPSPSVTDSGIFSQSTNTDQERRMEDVTALRTEETAASAVPGGELMLNNPNDERIEVRSAENVKTPRASSGQLFAQVADVGGEGREIGQPIENAPHDEAIPVSPSVSHVTTPVAMRVGKPMRPDDDDEREDEGEETAEEDEGGTEISTGREYRAEGYAGQRPTDLAEAASVTPAGDPQLGYNPSKYARVNATASPEVQDLFKKILEYEPFSAELPAKLRPFVPDYIPTVGDLDPFVKIPRPDGIPDGLGLEIVDEPTIPQSNPAVVLLELNATNAHGVAADVVDSLENAANRPEVIDRWISDIKKVHYKKALPTVNYQRPMPDIETLMQVWPQQFEEVLNSDIAFPPSHIDLDLDQYVRTLCAILDIPTYSSLIDSLHVMFTLYEEFCSNQHFQHV